MYLSKWYLLFDNGQSLTFYWQFWSKWMYACIAMGCAFSLIPKQWMHTHPNPSEMHIRYIGCICLRSWQEVYCFSSTKGKPTIEESKFFHYSWLLRCYLCYSSLPKLETLVLDSTFSFNLPYTSPYTLYSILHIPFFYFLWEH